MTLRELLDLKLVCDNVKIIKGSDIDVCEAKRIMGRPVEISDFKGIEEALDKQVVGIFGAKQPYKTIIEVEGK